MAANDTYETNTMSGQRVDRQLIALGRTLQVLRDQTTPAAQIDQVIAHVEAEFAYDLIWIGLYDRTTRKMVGQGGRTSGDRQILTQEFPLAPGDLLEQVLIQQRPAGLPNIQDSRAGRWQKIAQRLGIQGTLAFPIRHKDTCFGAAILGVNRWGVPAQASDKARLSMLFGELGAALFRLNQQQQQQQVKQTSAPLLALLSELSQLPSVAQRLTAISRETHQFIDAHRTYIYWLNRQERRFQHRIGQPGSKQIANNNAPRSTSDPPAHIAVQAVKPFYQSLTTSRLIAISDADAGQTEVGQLLQKLQTKALLASPILFQGELLGFLGVDSKVPRLWTPEEKDYIAGAAQLASLIAPLDSTEQAVSQVQENQALVAEVSHAIYSHDDWNQVLSESGDRLVQRLDIDRVWVLAYREPQERFDVRYERPGGPALPPQLDRLDKIDWQMLESSTDAIGIEDIDGDLKLMAWREAFLAVGVQSLLVCHTAINGPLQGLLIVGDDQTRVWNQAERDVLRAVAQQVGVVLRQFQLHDEVEAQAQIYDSIQRSLTLMQETPQLDALEQATVNHVAVLLQVPLVALLTWQPGQTTAHISAVAVSDPRFQPRTEADIDLQTDPLVHAIRQQEKATPIDYEAFAAHQDWLPEGIIGQLLGVELNTASSHQPSGILIVADFPGRLWRDRQVKTLEILCAQLAWARRLAMLNEAFGHRCQTLEQLNWYKHQRLDSFHHRLTQQAAQLVELSHQKDALSSLRYQQTVRELTSVLAATRSLLLEEQWQMVTQDEVASLVTLLKRVMEQVNPVVKARQLWVQIHHKSQALCIGSDTTKIELVLLEALTLACQRSPKKGRLDIWCRPLDFHWLEISITDYGQVPPNLLQALKEGKGDDMLTASVLDHQPGLHLGICQALMQQLGGNFSLTQLEDGRILSRLVVPITATGASASTNKGV